MFLDLVLNRFYVIGGDSDGAICEGGCEAEARPGTTCHRQTCSRRCCQTLCASGCMIHFRRIASVWLCDRYSGKANKTARGEEKPGKSSSTDKKKKWYGTVAQRSTQQNISSLLENLLNKIVIFHLLLY